MPKVYGPVIWQQIVPHYFGCYSQTGELVWGTHLKDSTPDQEIADLALFNGHTVNVTVDDGGGFTVEDVEVPE